jgi:hypothetical protein
VSDYFAHLAAAARRTVGEVRPRLPLPFEPGLFAPSAESEAPFAAEFVDDKPWEEPPQTPVLTKTLTLREAETPSPATVVAVPARGALVATPPITELEPAAAAAAPLPAAAPRASPAALPLAAPRMRTPAAPVPQPVLMLSAVRPVPTAEPSSVEAPSTAARDEPPPLRRSPPAIGRAPAAAPPSRPIRSARTAVTYPMAASPGGIAPDPTPLPPLMPRRERLRLDPVSWRAAAPPAETTIQVSIGRIEVRAPAAAPSRERPRTTSPVMSLDEYLRARAGRARL